MWRIIVVKSLLLCYLCCLLQTVLSLQVCLYPLLTPTSSRRSRTTACVVVASWNNLDPPFLTTHLTAMNNDGLSQEENSSSGATTQVDDELAYLQQELTAYLQLRKEVGADDLAKE
jgi:hypothetical protein